MHDYYRKLLRESQQSFLHKLECFLDMHCTLDCKHSKESFINFSPISLHQQEQEMLNLPIVQY